jgi:cholesterol transport system auxiliary component
MIKSLLLIIIILFINCGSILKKDYPTKKYYILEPDFTKVEKKELKFSNLKIIKTKISPYFEGKNFIYKHGNLNYDSDFYNEFLVFPSTNIYEIVNKWMIESGITNQVVQFEDDTYVMQINIDSLYTDISDLKKIIVFIDMQFLLNKSGDRNLLYNKKFSKNQTINEINPDLIASAWNSMITEIMIDFVKDLREISLPVSPNSKK